MNQLTTLNNSLRGRKMSKAAFHISMALIAASILISAFVALANSENMPTAPTIPIPASYFNLNILFHPYNNVAWPAEPFHGWRVWHALWFDLEPQKGQWKFDHLDKLVGEAQQNNSEMVLIMSYSPAWASSKPQQPADWKPGTAGPLVDINDWRDYVKTVGTRYKGKIHIYEMWNEPDRPKAWVGDMNTMVQMVREAYTILKGIDPTVTIVSPSATFPNGNAWLNDFLSKGGGQYVDVIGYHFYTGRIDDMAPPESVVPLIQKVKSIMTQHGIGDKPLWDTEAGWLGANLFPDNQQAAYVARAFVLNWLAGVSRYYYYAWDNRNGTQIEMVGPDFATPIPAAKSFATIQTWLTGSVLHRCLTSDNHDWVCELDQSGTWKYIVWNTDGDRSFRLAKNWKVSKVTQLDGSVAKIDGDTIHVGISPVLIQ